MRPRLELLDPPLLDRILSEAFQLIMEPGVRVAPQVHNLLMDAGITVRQGVAHIPENVARRALATVPREFSLYDRNGNATVRYGADVVHYDPGSSCLNVLDSETRQPRPAQAADLARLVQLTEMLPEFAAQSTAVVCDDVPEQIGDWYRLLVVLWYSEKPIITGAFSGPGLQTMLDLLAEESGGWKELRSKPRAIFDVCPSPPLNWSEFASWNLADLARAWVPAEIVSMPLAGATAPVTLAGSVVQHAAECISGIVIHQLAQPGAPIVWGGAPSIFDMSTGTTPLGSMESTMLNLACSQVGKSLGLPTHGYLVNTDGRSLDTQAGMESGISAVLGALAGINMISGAGMLDSVACHSLEKLVIDAEAIASAQRLVRGIEGRGESLATAMFEQTGLHGDFLRLKETRALFRSEQHFPSSVIERGGVSDGDAYGRARERVKDLLEQYSRPQSSSQREEAILSFAKAHAREAGLGFLPAIEYSEPRIV